MWKIKNVPIGEGIPKIIMPLVGVTAEEIVEEAGWVKEQAPDVVEWRVDLFEAVEDLEAVKGVLAKLRKIFADTLILFTFRSHKEGGNKVISEKYYVELNLTAIRTKWIDLVDVELFNHQETIQILVSSAKANGVYVIMSNHDFDKTPEKGEIVNRLRKMQEYGADIPKIAVMPESVADVITLLDATNIMKSQYADRPIITMSMGGTGLVSRVAGELFGSAFTFAAGRTASAPGQIPVQELRSILSVLHNRM